MARIRLENINKYYGKSVLENLAVENANLLINEGEFVVFVGPSGCGKTTMLRMIAGLEEISEGQLIFDDEVVNQHSPSERGVGMVFQSYALYPHLSVRENIAFGIKYTRPEWSKDEKLMRVSDIGDALEISHLMDKKPNELSGGQRQRIAIGRALVRAPKVFLLDEPLSNLDASLRARMRLKLAEFHKKMQSTTIYVTHDQVEAMTLADKIVVLKDGKIQQVGSPVEVYQSPVNEFVAGFFGSPKINYVGLTSLLKTKLCKLYPELTAKLTLASKMAIRPEDMQLVENGILDIKVAYIENLGAESIVYGANTFCEDLISLRIANDKSIVLNSVYSFGFDTQKILFFDDDKNLIV